MLWLFLYWAVVALIFLFTFYLIHKPLPAGIADRNKLQMADSLMRLVYHYPADLIDYFLGGEAHITYFRAVIAIVHAFRKFGTDTSGVKITNESIAGTDVRIYIPQERQNNAALVFIHGGGWITMNAEYYDSLTCTLARLLGVTVFSINYRLAPEHPFPCGIEDCEAVIRELHQQSYMKYDIDKEKICIVGDSAGGNLAAVVVQRFASRNEHFVKCQVLIYPVIHVFAFQLPSFREYYEKCSGTALLSPEAMARMILVYLGLPANNTNVQLLLANRHISQSKSLLSFEAWKNLHYFRELRSSPDFSECIGGDVANNEETSQDNDKELRHLQDVFSKKGIDPLISPLFGNLKGLPPAMVVTAEFDILRDEAIQYAKKLQKEGSPCEWKHYSTAYHGICSHPDSKVRNVIVGDICRFLMKHI